MPPNAITEAVDELAEIPELEILAEPYQREKDSKWTMEIRLTPGELDTDSSIPEETDWYVRINETYPGGKIRIYPDKETGITHTYPHQTLNTSGSADQPWRNGNICVDRYTNSIGRTGGFEEPFDTTERLRWYIQRAITWLELASTGELRQDGESYELPAFSQSASHRQFVYNETKSSFQTWSEETENHGVAYLSKLEDTTSRVAVDYVDLEGNSVYTPEWGDSVETEQVISGVWLLLKEPPIKPPWEVPEDWDDLDGLLSATEVNLFEVLGRTREANPQAAFSYFLLGFPIPETIGGKNAYIHWQAIEIDDIPDTSGFSGIRDLTNNRVRLARMSFKSESIRWLDSDNWAQEQLLRRGKLDETLRESNTMIIGAGALGSVVAENLLRDGCTNLTIVDGEKFEIGNLSRHTLSLDALNQYKATAVADRLRTLSPHATIHDVNSRYPLSESNQDAIPGPDIIIDCTGNDQVLHAFDQEPWESPRLIVSTALGPRGKRLYTYSTFTQSFEFTDFQERIELWTLKELSEHDPDEDFVPERVGCWHPASVITMHTIAIWGGIVPGLLEQAISLGRGQSSFTVMETSHSQGSTSVTTHDEPFPDTIRWKSENGPVLELPRVCLDEMIEYLQRDSPDETGGILTGRYSNERSGRIIRASDPPPDSIQSPTTFLRGTEKVDEALKESRERYGLYYIGEWHTHPDSAPQLSDQDKKEMQSIANNESYECPHPFLIIIGGNEDTGFTIKSYIFHRNNGYNELTVDSETSMEEVGIHSSAKSVLYTPGESHHD